MARCRDCGVVGVLGPRRGKGFEFQLWRSARNEQCSASEGAVPEGGLNSLSRAGKNQRMKILILNINYWPKVTGIGAFTTYRTEYLASAGPLIWVERIWQC